MKGLFRYFLGFLTLGLAVTGFYWLRQAVDPAANRHGEKIFTVRFSDAGNLAPGAALRSRGVQVGEVRTIELSNQGSHVLIGLSLGRNHQDLLHPDSRFWIVRPRFEGINQGIEGLDTILRSPYVVFDSPPGGDLKPAEPGTLFIGLAGPPPDLRLPPLQKEDFQFTLYFPRSNGLQPGSPVLLRDIPVGEVRSVELDASSQWAMVRVAIRRRFRETLRQGSEFWIQTPNVESGILASNMRAESLDRILSGPAVAYQAAPATRPLLQPGAVVAGSDSQKSFQKTSDGPLEVPASVGEADRLTSASQNAAAFLVGVSYAFVEEDLIGHENYYFEGSGVLFRSTADRDYVLTARSLSDGHFVVSDTFSRADISRQQWNVHSADGSAVEARPVWFDPGGSDLAILEMRKATPDAESIDQDLDASLDLESAVQLVAFGERGTTRSILLPPHSIAQSTDRGIYQMHSEYKNLLAQWTGAVALSPDGRVAAVIGRSQKLGRDAALISTGLLVGWHPDSNRQ